MVTDDLHTTLNKATKEILEINSENLARDCKQLTQKEEDEIRLHHILAWMREKAGGELVDAVIGFVLEICGNDDDDCAALDPAEREACDLHLLPLFAALRVKLDEQAEQLRLATISEGLAEAEANDLRLRAEEAERCAKESVEIMRRVRDSRDALREIARKAAATCPECRGEGYVVVRLSPGGSDMDGESGDPGEWDREDCEQCAALREIAGEKEEA